MPTDNWTTSMRGNLLGKRSEAYKESTGSVIGFSGTEAITNDDILTMPVDILIPAALENVITEKNAALVQAKSIVELANGPTTPEADKMLFAKGIIVVPDVLANAGGVMVSYFEWDQNIKGEHWSEQDVLEKLEARMSESFHDVWQTKEQFAIDMRTAAFVRAIERVASHMA